MSPTFSCLDFSPVIATTEGPPLSGSGSAPTDEKASQFCEPAAQVSNRVKKPRFQNEQS
jgi:hypothetical protein